MLSITNISIIRGHKKIIEQVSFDLPSGSVLGVLGTNGAGKSTLLAGISGEIARHTGRVMLNGRAMEDWPAIDRARQLAVLPQSAQLNFAFTAAEVVAFGRLPHKTGAQKDHEIVETVLALTDTQHLAQRNYLELSGGERQRVHLSRILAQLWPISEQSVLLLDEPTSMLDPLHQHTLLKVVKHCAQQGAAVIVILHDLNLAARYCDRILLLDQGHVFIDDTPAKALTADSIEHIFGLSVTISRHPTLGCPLIIPN